MCIRDRVGDLDGDGELEIVVKREPYDGANQGGWRNGTTLLEAYKMNGTLLWQIDLGINIRSGSHYTSYILYDFDGDGSVSYTHLDVYKRQYMNRR